MTKLLLPVLYAALIIRPMFLGDLLLNAPSNPAGVLPIAAQVAKAMTEPVSESQTFEVWVTAYSSAPEETDSSPLITATNKTVQDGFIAANFLPFGTKVKIPKYFGDKIFVVEDRMHRRKENFMDVWMPTREDALNFGIHRAEVTIVEMGTIPNPMTLPPITKNTVNENPAQD